MIETTGQEQFIRTSQSSTKNKYNRFDQPGEFKTRTNFLILQLNFLYHLHRSKCTDSFVQTGKNICDKHMYNTTQVSSDDYEIDPKRYVNAFYLLIAIVLKLVYAGNNVTHEDTCSTKQVSFLYIYITLNTSITYNESYVNT